MRTTVKSSGNDWESASGTSFGESSVEQMLTVVVFAEPFWMALKSTISQIDTSAHQWHTNPADPPLRDES